MVFPGSSSFLVLKSLSVSVSVSVSVSLPLTMRRPYLRIQDEAGSSFSSQKTGESRSDHHPKPSMSDTTPAFTEWLQFYQTTQPSPEVPLSGLSNATAVVTSPTGENKMTPVTPPTSITGGGDLSPRASIGKPARRRSRASRRTPTTLLNASATNFRALVQQFTGCQSSFSSSSGSQSGPFNLNFAATNEQNYYGTTSTTATSGLNHYSQPNPWHEQQHQQQQQQQQLYPNQRYMFSSVNNNNDAVPSAYGNPTPNTWSSHNYVMANNPSHELAGDSTFNGERNDDHSSFGCWDQAFSRH
ncbi:unnamed protein product [Ilex paraguariensis]|uniref:VQ domain-containing protein n=1 Tax=Ilex paraguariensis TaxID=185542 RepID=A0ABC8TRG3_9AQUA